MIIARIKGCTRVLGRSQGYRGLPIADVTIDEAVGGAGSPAMVSAWELTPDELERLKAGAHIRLTVMGTVHPPVILSVGDPPDKPAGGDA